MKCIKCNAVIADDSKFCSECGGKVKVEIECANCKTINSESSKFCKQCGLELSSSSLTTRERIVLKNDFFLKLFEKYYKKLFERIKLYQNADDLHSQVRTFDSKILENEYNLSVNQCFDHLMSSCRKYFTKNDIQYIQQKKDYFLSNDSSNLFRILSELDIATNDVVKNVSNSTTEGILKGLGAGAAAGAVAGSIIPGAGNILGSIIGAAAGFVAGDKIEEEEKRILDKWNMLFDQIIEQYDILWEKLFNLIGEDIEEHTQITDEVDEVALVKSIDEWCEKYTITKTSE